LETRLSRLSEEEKKEAHSLMETLNNTAIGDKNTPFARLGALFTRADTCNPLNLEDEVIEVNYYLYESVWRDAAELRDSGKLVELGKQIRCPVVALHGDYDPHPPEGIRKPLSAVLGNFRFIMLKNCGHLPWMERMARDRFYEILKEELR